MHISTTYCNTDKEVVAEQLYPAHTDWRRAIDMIENVDPHMVQILTSKYCNTLPNTYTFSKSLAEHAVNDICTNKIPVVIYRPSIGKK